MFRQIKGNGTLYRVENNGKVIDLTARELEQLVREIYEADKDLVDEQTGARELREEIDELREEVARLENDNEELRMLIDED